MSSPSPEDNFPLGRKAISHHMGMARRLGGVEGKASEELREMLEDIVDLIDLHTDGTDAEKDVIIAASILNMMPPPARSDEEKITAGYSDKVAKLIQKIDRSDITAPPDKETARANVAIMTAMFAFMADRAFENPAEFTDPRIAAEMKMAYAKTSAILEKAEAPELAGNFEESYKDLLDGISHAASSGHDMDDGFADDYDDDDGLEIMGGLESLPPPTTAGSRSAARMAPLSARPPAPESALPPDIEKALRDLLGDEGSFDIINGDDMDIFPGNDDFGDDFGGFGAPAINMDELRVEADKILKAAPEFNDAAADKLLASFDPDVLKKYPDVKPALQDLNRMFGLATGEALPEKEIRSAAEAIKIVDAAIEGDDEAKCDAAIATVLMRVPPHFATSGIDTSLARDYGPNVEKYIRDISAINFGGEPTARVQPLVFANLIADVDGSISDIAAGRAGEVDIKHMRDSAFAFSERMAKMKIAPAARALSEQLEESFVKLLDAADDHAAKVEAAAKAGAKPPRP